MKADVGGGNQRNIMQVNAVTTMKETTNTTTALRSFVMNESFFFFWNSLKIGKLENEVVHEK
jgi:hypothetical protein